MGVLDDHEAASESQHYYEHRHNTVTSSNVNQIEDVDAVRVTLPSHSFGRNIIVKNRWF